MVPPQPLPPPVQVAAWLGSAAILGGLGLVVVGMTYQEYLDCSNPELHESADTAFGWAVAVVTSTLPVAVAAGVAGGLRRRLTALATVVALLSLALWRWALVADCEWATLPLG